MHGFQCFNEKWKYKNLNHFNQNKALLIKAIRFTYVEHLEIKKNLLYKTNLFT